MNHTDWSELAEEWWKFYAAREYLAGGFAWTGFDYRGEPTPYGWPSISSQFGIVDLCGFPKDNFYYYKAWWGREPVLHLFPHWNWEQRLGEPVRVWVHSNLDEVELFLNGRSQGRQKCRAADSSRVAGEVRARRHRSARPAQRQGRHDCAARNHRRTGDDPAELPIAVRSPRMARISPSCAWRSSTAPAEPVPTADNVIKFTVSGAGRFLGVGNGDPNCQESDKEPLRSLFNGLAQLIVQAGREPGDISIEAHAKSIDTANLASTRLTIPARKVDPRPAVA